MKKLLFSIVITISCLQGLMAQYNESEVQQYIALFKDLAVKEQVRTRVPASIKLAQGILETGAGTSELCLNAANHFGIKCKSNWSGDSYVKDDDRRDECFRKYTSAQDSYIDHSDFLKNNKRYEALFALPTEDYVSWAKGLKKCGYATNPAYADKLISLIERYNLNEYTLLAMKATDQRAIAANNTEMSFGYGARPASYVTTKEPPIPEGDQPDISYYTITALHGKKGFYAKKGDALLEYAIKNKIRYTKLLSYNDLEDAPLPCDMFIYIEKKNDKGARAHIISREGESLQLISQNEGITLEALRKLNHLSAGEEPAAGTRLYLQNDAGQKPQLAGNTDNISNDPGTAYKNEQEAVYIDKSDLNIREEAPGVSIPAANEKAVIETTAPRQENNVVTEQQAIPEKDLPVSRKKEEDNTVKEPVSDIDRLKQKMDRSVYGSTPVTEEKATPAPQEKKESVKQETPVIKQENTLNRPGKSDPQQEPVASTRKPAEEVIEKPVYTNTANDKFYNNQKSASSSPKEALSSHMSLVEQGKVPRYNPKASGIEHTSAPVTRAPKKVVKRQPKKSAKGKKQVVAKSKAGTKKKIAATKAPTKKNSSKKKK